MLNDQVNEAVSHVGGLFDIVGKTVDNVTYAPAQYNDTEQFWIHFTDGTSIHVVASECISAVLETPDGS